MLRLRLFVLMMILCGASCKRHSHTVTRGFYYWKTNLGITAFEQLRLAEANCHEIFLRCFDVVKGPDGVVRPAGILRNLSSAPAGLRIVPVVYITQDALQTTTARNIPALATNIDKLLHSLFEGKTAPAEIQLDCDWTASSRERYFALLRELRGQAFFEGKRLSCTIRLHQIKFQSRSGVPPVDRGLLMCYNMGSLKAPGTHNSILNPALAEDYLQHLGDYPLPLDLALPLFDWSLLFRDGRFNGILRDVSPEMIAGSPLFRPSGTNLFSSLADTVFAGYALRRGDQIRVERAAPGAILQMGKFAAAHIRNDSLRVLLFHCDSLILAKHPHEELEAIYRTAD